MKSFSPHLLVFLVLLLLTLFSPFAAQNVTYNIEIASEMPSQLNVSCYNCRNDTFYGIEKISRSLTFQFDIVYDPEIGINNTVVCAMRADSDHHGSFVVFDYERDVQNCAETKQCLWYVRPDGIYESFDDSKNLIYTWSVVSPLHSLLYFVY